MDSDSELEELQSLFSDHFGRTPLQTPAVSQQDSEEDANSEADDDVQASLHDATINSRARGYLIQNEDNYRSDISSSDDEDFSDQTDDDELNIERFVKRGCGCNLKCSEEFTVSQLYDHVLTMREMDKNEKELFIMGTLGKDIDTDTTKRGKKRKRIRHRFKFGGKNVCKNTFLVAYDIGRNSLQSLITHYNEKGATPRKHGNSGKKPVHALKFEDVKLVVHFITNYADEFGIPQPAAPRVTDNIPPIYLTSDTTKKRVHDLYVSSCCNMDTPVRSVKISTFKGIWQACLHHIKIASPRDDVCAKCEKMRKCIVDAVTEEEKLQSLNDMKEHVIRAQQERELYNACIKRSKESRDEEREAKYNHYTFDFSQNVSLPHHSRQMGPLYFLSLRKVQIFGFRIDGEQRQLNFLVDENETIGRDGSESHGPNAVISMVDWALESHGDVGASCAIHADNCPGQNKNQFVLGYFMWRVMTGQNSTIEYMMQIPGHARCLVDSGFANIKKLYRRSDCETVGQLETLVNRSSATNEAVRYSSWHWRDWKTFLRQYFQPITGIRKYQYFKMSADETGVVTVRTGRDDADAKMNILKDPDFRFPAVNRPRTILARGLSRQRQDYLFATVRPYVRPVFQDDLCPAP